jgi:hypothetical protein
MFDTPTPQMRWGRSDGIPVPGNSISNSGKAALLSNYTKLFEDEQTLKQVVRIDSLFALAGAIVDLYLAFGLMIPIN